MTEIIRVRDVVRGAVYEAGPRQRALRVSYDMFHPHGPVQLRDDGHVEWSEGEDERRARYTDVPLGVCHPGERVLLHLDQSAPENEWWLADVVAVDGVKGD